MGWMVSILFLTGLALIVYTFTGAFAGFGMYYPALSVLSVVLMFVSLSLAWEMDRWGPVLFAVFVSLRLALDLWSGAFTWWETLFVIPLLYFAFFRARFS